MQFSFTNFICHKLQAQREIQYCNIYREKSRNYKKGYKKVCIKVLKQISFTFPIWYRNKVIQNIHLFPEVLCRLPYSWRVENIKFPEKSIFRTASKNCGREERKTSCWCSTQGRSGQSVHYVLSMHVKWPSGEEACFWSVQLDSLGL